MRCLVRPTSSMILALSVAGLWSAGCTRGPDGTTTPPTVAADPEAVRQEVTEVLRAYRIALDGRDADGIRAAYVDDGRFTWLEDGAVRYRSADDVLAALAAIPEGMPLVTTLSDVRVEPVGDRAARADASFETTMGEGEQAFSFGGVISFVLERGPTGWRIVGGHTSSRRQQESDWGDTGATRDDPAGGQR